jgi:hypothetical protein
MRYARARASWKAIANQGQHDDQQKSSVEAGNGGGFPISCGKNRGQNVSERE